MTDIRDAMEWVRSESPTMTTSPGVPIYPHKTVVAMSLAWTTLAAGIHPPNAILAFHGTSDYGARGMPFQQQTLSSPLALTCEYSVAGIARGRVSTTDHKSGR